MASDEEFRRSPDPVAEISMEDSLVIIGSFCIGLYALARVFGTKTEIAYPTPENAGRIKYVDDRGQIYVYRVVPIGPQG